MAGSSERSFATSALITKPRRSKGMWHNILPAHVRMGVPGWGPEELDARGKTEQRWSYRNTKD
jgi:hypothetical protein